MRAAGRAGAYLVRMFAITGFYHRYFSHRSFKTSRTGQFIFGLLGAVSGSARAGVVGGAPSPPSRQLRPWTRTCIRPRSTASCARTWAGS